MARIAVNRGFHFELFETQEKLFAVREQYLKAISGLRKQGEVIHIILGEPTLKIVHRNIWKRVKTRLLDTSFLPSLDEQKILSWKELKEIRQESEDKLGLTFQGVKEYLPTRHPIDPTKGNAGSYSLEFLDENATEYHIIAYLNSRQNRIVKIIAMSGAKGNNLLKKLNSICNNVQNSNVRQ